MFGKKKQPQPPVPFDPENQVPILKCSICNGEQVAGFKDKFLDSAKEKKAEFIVLNANYMKCGDQVASYDSKVFRKGKDVYPLVPSQEKEWLRRELEDPDQEYIIFSHHSLANDFGNRGVVNRREIQSLLPKRKVLLCMNGHDHGDDCRIPQGIPYYTLNSMSYAWLGMNGHYQTVMPEDVGMERRWNDVSIEPQVSGFQNWKGWDCE